MDTDLKCNRLTCRQSLTDKAVVVSPNSLAYLFSRAANWTIQTTCKHFTPVGWGWEFDLPILSPRGVTGSHIFCGAFKYFLEHSYSHHLLLTVECANELFNAARLCPGIAISISWGPIAFINLHSVRHEPDGAVINTFNPYLSMRILMNVFSDDVVRSHAWSLNLPTSHLFLISGLLLTPFKRL